MIEAMDDIPGFRVLIDVVTKVVRYKWQREVVIRPKREISIWTDRKLRIRLLTVQRCTASCKTNDE